MNTSLSAYTHLESLLLFQSLACYGVEPPVFSRISDLLKKNTHVNSDRKFEAGRLSPDALRNFYLQVLKEEIKAELKGERHEGALDGEGQNGDVKSSRKRKAPSPSLPTVQEAAQHAHLIPQLVTRLYARYRKAVTDQVREDEYKYDKLQRDLQEIERGEWDGVLQDRLNGNTRSPSQSKKSPLLAPDPVPNAGAQVGVPDGPIDGASSINRQPDGPQPTPQPVSGDPPKSPSQNGHVPNDRSANNIPAASPRKKQPVVDQRGAPATPSGHVPSPQQTRTPQPLAPPRFPSNQPPNAGFNGSPPTAHRSPYPPQGAPPQVPHSLPSAAPIAHPPPQHGLTAGVVPPPSNVHYPPPQPGQDFGANGAPQYGPPHGAPIQYSPTHQRVPGSYLPPGPQSPGVQTPQQQPRNLYGSYPGQPPFPHTPQQQTPMPPQPPPQSGFMLPPFQVQPQAPHDQSRAQHPHAPPAHNAAVSTPVAGRPSLPPSRPNNSTIATPQMPPLHPAVLQAREVISTPVTYRTPLSAMKTTPVSAKTRWKPFATHPVTPSASRSESPRPSWEPFDDLPTPEQVKQPQSQFQTQARAKSSRKSRAKIKGKEKVAEKDTAPESQQTEDRVPEMETPQGNTTRKPATRRQRPGSIASSHAGTSARERSRSQSVASHTETIPADNESTTGTRVKSESGTTIDTIEEDFAATPAQLAMTRRRGGTVQSLQSNKRKRNAREASLADSEDSPSTPDAGARIIAPRHFSKMCNPIMNEITSHKHASTFTTAVRAKDADGYYDLIKRPTDLKTIQKAITAGGKAVAAAATDTPAGSPGGGGGNVQLPLSADVVPPKAIVNPAQLEKELMRMFTNAVMFNMGEEGVVEDAREMFESVERSVSNWRSAERGRGRLEVEETPPMLEEEAPLSKRRKI